MFGLKSLLWVPVNLFLPKYISKFLCGFTCLWSEKNEVVGHYSGARERAETVTKYSEDSTIVAAL